MVEEQDKLRDIPMRKLQCKWKPNDVDILVERLFEKMCFVRFHHLVVYLDYGVRKCESDPIMFDLFCFVWCVCFQLTVCGVLCVVFEIS